MYIIEITLYRYNFNIVDSFEAIGRNELITESNTASCELPKITISYKQNYDKIITTVDCYNVRIRVYSM